MLPRSLSYPSVGDSPTLFVNIINPKTGRPQIFQMLVDTGASRTCLPAARAEFLGHDNLGGKVKTTEVSGVGGKSKAFIHTLTIELIDPDGKIWRKLIPPWRSKVMPILFVEKMETQAGILGRDILSQWKHICFRPTPKTPHSTWVVDLVL
jgi:hypothetical protein